MARRSWTNLRTEHIKRVGQEGNSNYTSRAEAFLEAAYFDISRIWHHFAFDSRDAPAALVTGTPSIAVPATALIVTALYLYETDGTTRLGSLKANNAIELVQRIRPANEKPAEWGRWGSLIYLDKPPDKAYQVEIFYYAQASSPVFDATTPAMYQGWDERILELSLAYAHGAIWRPDLAGLNAQTLSQWAQQFPEPVMKQVPLYDVPGLERTGRPHGGMQG